ncbi:hypothetical protein [Thermoleptolyngbya sp.]
MRFLRYPAIAPKSHAFLSLKTLLDSTWLNWFAVLGYISLALLVCWRVLQTQPRK